MSMTAVPISILFVRAPTAARSGNGEPSWRAKWWTRKYAPSRPSSSAATARSIDCSRASDAVRTLERGDGVQCPKERKPIFFTSLRGGLVSRLSHLPVEERQLVRELAVSLRLGRAHAVPGVEVHEEQHRPAAGGRRLQVRRHLARLPRRDARVVEAGGEQYGRIGRAGHDVLRGVHGLERTET